MSLCFGLYVAPQKLYNLLQAYRQLPQEEAQRESCILCRRLTVPTASLVREVDFAKPKTEGVKNHFCRTI